ncbi:MATE family efflux transporter [Paenibacillus sp. J5C_2022]|uniref:MATE family efflux transporter n=1 Tax=Paenibacillus sp. J5C2022 TaxID=2977129 RepID=UPI0021CF1A94|nr:MATE family efflux transporter [Paenibacillus sp. J5C2022]MCU6712992.1 MATE family efflux transporter [Paenibacillus sp. J5C2022]
METITQNKLSHQPVKKVFFQYLIPSIIGMMLMSINIVVDGIFVGHGVGTVALASVNIAVPVFSIIMSISLWIGIGGGALYSMALGEQNVLKARNIFSFSIVMVALIVMVFSFIGYSNVERLADLLGANQDTRAFVVEYLSVLLLFGVFIAVENALSIFIRNDGNPQLAMISLIITAVTNIILNYYMIFVAGLGVKGAALATVTSGAIGLLVLLFHFFRKDIALKFIFAKWAIKSMRRVFSIGFPSFLAEMGALVFVIGYNLMMVKLAGTDGVAAFSVINYLHAFIFLSFFGIGSAIQPMISYYYGANRMDRIRDTVKIAEKSALVIGAFFLLIGAAGAQLLVSLFGVSSDAVRAMAVQGIPLFFVGYLFMGINFIYMTYYQSIGHTGPSNVIIIMRGFVLLLAALWILPQWMGIKGVWLSLPASELLVAVALAAFTRKNVLQPNSLSGSSPGMASQK